ncbi:MAG: oxidoreductase membrane subunit [Lachnospiraceae bacterium]|nr:oxidoreductase membrane subunit [Lachnospiraceae bacterium]
MKNLTFRKQFGICIGILIISFIFANITKIGIFTNIAWIIYGLTFVINPVWPEIWDHLDHKKLKLGCRIGGILVLIVALITRFGV